MRCLNHPGFALFALTLLNAATPSFGQLFFEEDFESLTLNPIVTFNTEIAEREAWTNVGPAGWDVDASDVPGSVANDGVQEFRGWTFVDKDWWTATAGDQNRSAYTFGYGTVAVADNDEFDDFSLGSGDGVGPAYDGCEVLGVCYDTALTTPVISTSGVGENELRVVFDSSYRPEHAQDVALEVSFNGGDFQRVFKWLSTDSTGIESTYTPDLDENNNLILDDRGRPTGSFNNGGTFTQVIDANDVQVGDLIPDNAQVNEVIDIPLNNPEGTNSVQVRWNMTDGGNDWWWAVDNIQVYAGTPAPRDPALTMLIDQNTGEVSITNGTSGAVDLRGYQAVSADGNFDADGASFLGDGDSDWVVLSEAGSGTDLSEGHIGSYTIAQGETISLGTAWEDYYRASGDVLFEYLVDGNSESVLGLVEFVGDSNPFLDLNFDGVFDILDWNEFLAITDTVDLSDLTVAQAYRKGDLNGDLQVSISDFVTFQREYDRVFGAGAFALASAGIPEPTSAALFGLGLVAVATRRRNG